MQTQQQLEPQECALIWQCAWCGYIKNGHQAGEYLAVGGRTQMLDGATHGICDECSYRVRREIAMVRVRRAIAALEAQ